MLDFCVTLVQISVVYEIVIVTFHKIYSGPVLMQQGSLFSFVSFFLPSSLEIIFCLDCQARIRRLGKDSASWKEFYCKWSGESWIYVPGVLR